MGDVIELSVPVRFKPSELVLEVPPFPEAFGSKRHEFAVALMVYTCRMLGDQWGPLLPEAIGGMGIEAAKMGVEPFASLILDARFAPDFPRLVAAQLARWRPDFRAALPANMRNGEPAIELEPRAILKLARWVKQPAAGAAT
jgi:hypothetical protein